MSILARTFSAPSAPARSMSSAPAEDDGGSLRAGSSKKTFSALHRSSAGSPPPSSPADDLTEERHSPRSPTYPWDSLAPPKTAEDDAEKDKDAEDDAEKVKDAEDDAEKDKDAEDDAEKVKDAEDDGPKTPTAPRDDYSDAELLAAVEKVVEARKAMNLIIGRPVDSAVDAIEAKLGKIRRDVETVQGAISAASDALEAISKRFAGTWKRPLTDVSAEPVHAPAEPVHAEPVHAPAEPVHAEPVREPAEPAEKKAKHEPADAKP